jgi:hypothetical protein
VIAGAVCAAGAAEPLDGGGRGGGRVFFGARNGNRSRPKFGAQAADQFRREIGNVHALRDDEFAAEDRARLVVIGKLAIDAAILAFLVPAEAAVGNRFGTDELKSAQKGIALRDRKTSDMNGASPSTMGTDPRRSKLNQPAETGNENGAGRA